MTTDEKLPAARAGAVLPFVPYQSVEEVVLKEASAAAGATAAPLPSGLSTRQRSTADWTIRTLVLCDFTVPAPVKPPTATETIAARMSMIVTTTRSSDPRPSPFRRPACASEMLTSENRWLEPAFDRRKVSDGGPEPPPSQDGYLA